MFEITSVIAWLQKTIKPRDIFIVCGIFLLYLVIRLLYLDRFPIFSDEGIYINWAKIAANDANWRFISLIDGKQPLQTWLSIPFIKILAEYPLIAGRLVAVLTGAVALSGIMTLLGYLSGKKAAYIGGILYIISPYFIFYDRLAMIDSGVNAAFIWILFFSIFLARNRRLDIALIFGIVGGFALLAKSSVTSFLGLSALAPVMYLKQKPSEFWRKTVNYLLLLGLVIFIALFMYQIQRLSPFYANISQKNGTFLLTPAELLSNPFQVFFRNFPLVPYYILSEMGYATGLIGLTGFYFLYKKDEKLAWYLGLWFILPVGMVMFVADVLFPRYIIFIAGLLTIMAGYAMASIKSKNLLIGSWIVVLASVAYLNYTIIYDQANIPFPPVDRGQYIEDWPAGTGAKEIMEIARELSKHKTITLIAEGDFGMAGDVLNTLKTPKDKNIRIEGKWPLNLEDVKAYQARDDAKSIYIVFSHRTEFPPDWPVVEVAAFPKPSGRSTLYLHKLKPLGQ